MIFHEKHHRPGPSDRARGSDRTLTRVLPELGCIRGIDHQSSTDASGTRIALEFARNQEVAVLLRNSVVEGGNDAEIEDR